MTNWKLWEKGMIGQGVPQIPIINRLNDDVHLNTKTIVVTMEIAADELISLVSSLLLQQKP